MLLPRQVESAASAATARISIHVIWTTELVDAHSLDSCGFFIKTVYSRSVQYMCNNDAKIKHNLCKPP